MAPTRATSISIHICTTLPSNSGACRNPLIPSNVVVAQGNSPCLLSRSKIGSNFGTNQTIMIVTTVNPVTTRKAG